MTQKIFSHLTLFLGIIAYQAIIKATLIKNTRRCNNTSKLADFRPHSSHSHPDVLYLKINEIFEKFSSHFPGSWVAPEQHMAYSSDGDAI